MKWEKATQKEHQVFKIPNSWLRIHYYEALNILFRIENALRVFVYIILKNEVHGKWIDLNITSDDSEQGTISSIAKKRLSQAENFGYLGYSIKCPIMSLTSGELIGLITSESYWKYFKGHFMGSKEIIKNKLNELGAIRNSLAHFRPIKQHDVEVIKQNALHVLMTIEKYLTQMVSINNVVPTNTKEDWYKQLNTLGNDSCSFRFFQCEKEHWIEFRLTFHCTVLLERKNSSEYIRYRVLNFVSSAVLKKYKNLKNFLTYLSEYVPYTTFQEEEELDIRKELSFVFSRKILSDNYEKIKKDFEDLLQAVSKETKLINSDNLARGEVLKTEITSTSLRKLPSGRDYWSVDLSAFECPVKDDDPPEYWGTISKSVSDFVAQIEKYPWMPEEISESDVPF